MIPQTGLKPLQRPAGASAKRPVKGGKWPAKRRLNLPHERILAYVNLVLQPMNLVAPSTELLAAALAIRQENGFSFYDSLILAAAQAAQCQVLYSEDMQHLHRVGNLQVVNPFLDLVNERAAAR